MAPTVDSAPAADKKEKKHKRSEAEGVAKPKKDKKDKKRKKEKLAQALDEHLQASAAASAAEEDVSKARAAVDNDDDASDVEMGGAAAGGKPVIRGAMVEFALPLASDKHQKKVYKVVKKGAKAHALLRGVKEVNKALRKATPKNPSSSTSSPPGIVIVAGDVSPAEVVMHLPLAAEDVGAPYMFVASRAELGAAAKTKRPTSVIMLLPQGRKARGGKDKKKDADDEEGDAEKDRAEYAEGYAELVKLVQKEFARQMKGRI